MHLLDKKTGGLWSAFQAQLTSRMEAGAREYGDASFQKTAPRTLTEIEEELLDVCGWGFILFVRLERLRADLLRFEDLSARPSPPWLGDLNQILGTSGGTIHQCLAEVRSLQNFYVTNKKGPR